MACTEEKSDHNPRIEKARDRERLRALLQYQHYEDDPPGDSRL